MRDKDNFVFLPHRACLTIQIAGSYMALPEYRDRALVWLRITHMLANKQSVTRTKLDQEMGNLALLFTRKRIIKQMLTFEIIYYLMQLPRLSNSLLTLVISRVTS